MRGELIHDAKHENQGQYSIESFSSISIYNYENKKKIEWPDELDRSENGKEKIGGSGYKSSIQHME